MPLPEALFAGVQTDAGTDETLTTEPTPVPVDMNGDPLGGVPPNMLDANGALPAGILIRRRHGPPPTNCRSRSTSSRTVASSTW